MIDKECDKIVDYCKNKMLCKELIEVEKAIEESQKRILELLQQYEDNILKKIKSK